MIYRTAVSSKNLLMRGAQRDEDALPFPPGEIPQVSTGFSRSALVEINPGLAHPWASFPSFFFHIARVRRNFSPRNNI